MHKIYNVNGMKCYFYTIKRNTATIIIFINHTTDKHTQLFHTIYNFTDDITEISKKISIGMQELNENTEIPFYKIKHCILKKFSNKKRRRIK